MEDINELNNAVTSIQDQLKDVASQSSVDQLNKLITANEAAGQQRSEAISNAITDLSSQLGVTEERLVAEILGAESRMTSEIDAIADMIGKPANRVTDVDIDFVTDIIAQQEALGELLQYNQQQLGYDVTGDGIIDINDLNLIQRVQQGEQIDLTQGRQFQQTGLYDFTQNLAQQTQQRVSSEAERTRQQALAGDILGILETQDITGREVTVQAPDPARIGYLYDFSSIFATPQQEGMFVSPYGGQRGYAKGGSIIDANEELLRLLGD